MFFSFLSDFQVFSQPFSFCDKVRPVRRNEKGHRLRLNFDSVDHVSLLESTFEIIQAIFKPCLIYSILHSLIYHLHIWHTQFMHIYPTSFDQDIKIYSISPDLQILENDMDHGEKLIRFSRCSCRLIEVPWARHLWLIWSLKGSKRHRYVGKSGDM